MTYVFIEMSCGKPVGRVAKKKKNLTGFPHKREASMYRNDAMATLRRAIDATKVENLPRRCLFVCKVAFDARPQVSGEDLKTAANISVV